ncbi:MAG: hypothetical protein IKU52_05130 [Clostridia bacterium]|nr:hypothetical protein [Clostridia bacterium]
MFKFKKEDDENLKLPIGDEEIASARQILGRYKRDKMNLEQKIISNEDWWKLRHWEQSRKNKDDFKPASAWLWNVIVSKHAETMDSFPEPNILPRMPDDRDEAKKLSSVIPLILEQNDIENVYSDIQWYKLKQGTGVYGIFWDSTKNGGLGDISVKKVDLLSLFWEGGVNNIQDSKNLFYVNLCDNESLIEAYPQLDGKLMSASNELARYRYDDNVDINGKSAVVDWYYRKHKNGKTILHFCKFVGDTLLFSTENLPNEYPNGWYEHGLYPFVFDPLYSIEGTPCGYGYIDIAKDTQMQIDLLNNSIVNNAMLASKPRYFIRGDGSINEEEFADWTKDFVHTNSTLGKDSILQIDVNPINGIYVNILNNKIDEIKETLGNRDSANGGISNGVTAASAIAALQEAGGKLSRDSTRASYCAYKLVIAQCIELVRQFYDCPRFFRIIGKTGESNFTSYSNKGILPKYQGERFGMDMGYRMPVFDIEISVQKCNPYSKMSQNELALQFYNLGFFEPSKSEMALSCLEMMDFPRKESIINRIIENSASRNNQSVGTLPLANGKKAVLPGEAANIVKAKMMAAESVSP